MINILCVRVGTKYGIEYVTRLRDMVARHLPEQHQVICLTDQHQTTPDVTFVDIGQFGLPGWWAKMALFWYQAEQCHRSLYFDLDTVIVDDLTPLAKWRGPFAICENFTRLAGHTQWPCRYGSCVMSLPAQFGGHIWERFISAPHRWMAECPRGDQQAIEQLHPCATYLQSVVPEGYFVCRRGISDIRPTGAAVMIFAGRYKPHNTKHQWLYDEWVGNG